MTWRTAGFGGDGLVHEVLQETGVREIETGIHAEGQNFGIGDDIVAGDVTEMRGAGYLAHDCHMWLRSAVQVEKNREAHACKQAGLDPLN